MSASGRGNAVGAAVALGGRLVLEFGGYIAGPMATTALAWAGADVIKIETPHGDPFRAFGFGFYGWNQSKRGLVLDFTKPEAREVVADLVRKADVLVENMRPGATRRLGIDYETMCQLNPRLVYASITAFGSSGLRGLGIPAGPVLGIDEVFTDPHIAANELLMTSNAPPWGEFQQTGTVVKYGAAPVPVRTGPQRGEHTVEILRSLLGYTPERIQQLEANGAVITAGTRSSQLLNNPTPPLDTLRLSGKIH